MIEFPSTIPAPSVDYAFEVKGRTVLFRQNKTFPQGRQRDGKTLFGTAVRWRLTKSEMKMFTWFFENNLSRGTQPFVIDLFSSGVLEWHSVQFFQAEYSHSVDSVGMYAVTARLISVETPVITEEELDLLLSGELDTWEAFEAAVGGLAGYLDEILPSDGFDDYFDAIEKLIAYLTAIGAYP